MQLWQGLNCILHKLNKTAFLACFVYLYTLLLSFQSGDTALHIAASMNDIEAMKVLINCGANVNDENKVQIWHIFLMEKLLQY